MKENIKFIYFIKIFMYSLLIWAFHFYSDKSSFNKILCEKYGSGKKLYERIYRLLEKGDKGIFSNVGDLELKIPYNKKKKNKHLFTIENEKRDEEKKEKLYRSALIKEKLIKRLMKNKCTMLHKSYNHYEKKIMNGLDDKDFFRKIMLINDKDYKRLKRKKYRLRLCILLLLFLSLLIIPILDLSIDNILMALFTLLDKGTSAGQGASSALPGATPNTSWSIYFSNNPSALYKAQSILMHCVPIILMGLILIIGIFYCYKNVIKHKKIKYLEAFNEW
ncbi:Plasmodium exported protein, unknown function [Plasmodium malariae]|uniref:Fam-l protein n=1 Tax=Plasmodium malariae TaxID=5858 RepID=A0A1D3TDM6_PLAMA|nr:Plasmodium exported protein, unknown function [Plasmodium malariae]SCP03020.1 Plasmodium exported protein, unknown function [Plasmodium malariae]